MHIFALLIADPKIDASITMYKLPYIHIYIQVNAVGPDTPDPHSVSLYICVASMLTISEQNPVLSLSKDTS